MKISIARVKPAMGFSVSRYWGGKIVLISLRWYLITLDSRKDWLADMEGKPQGSE
jgi:hypothetical protein